MKCPVQGKTCLSENSAKKSAGKFKKTNVDRYMRAYKCQFCEWWHLTHNKTV